MFFLFFLIPFRRFPKVCCAFSRRITWWKSLSNVGRLGKSKGGNLCLLFQWFCAMILMLETKLYNPKIVTVNTLDRKVEEKIFFLNYLSDFLLRYFGYTCKCVAIFIQYHIKLYFNMLLVRKVNSIFFSFRVFFCFFFPFWKFKC